MLTKTWGLVRLVLGKRYCSQSYLNITIELFISYCNNLNTTTNFFNNYSALNFRLLKKISSSFVYGQAESPSEKRFANHMFFRITFLSEVM